MNQYKTLKTIDGQDYITVAEHEQIMGGWHQFEVAVNDLRSSVAGLGKFTSDLTTTLKN